MSDHFTFNLPQLGNGIDEAIIVEWLVTEGESVAAGDPIVTIETDKAQSDLEAPVDGVLVRVVAQDGAEVEIGAPLAEFEVTAK